MVTFGLNFLHIYSLNRIYLQMQSVHFDSFGILHCCQIGQLYAKRRIFHCLSCQGYLGKSFNFYVS